MKKDKEKEVLQIFQLCKKLSELLGDNDTIVDLKRRYNAHPEMFSSLKDVAETIEKIVSQEDDNLKIIQNPKAINDRDFIAGKALSSEKWGDVGIKNDERTNIIFHVNKIRIKNAERNFLKKGSLVETPTLSTRQDLLTGGECHKDMVSTTFNEIIAQNNDNTDYSAVEEIKKEMAKKLDSKKETKSRRQ